MNLIAEITFFADHRFYQDWWNAGNLGEYWRKWNLPVHHFLIRHIYYPCRRAKIGKEMAMLIVFFVSAVVHEYLMIAIFRVVNFVAFTLMMANVPIIIV